MKSFTRQEILEQQRIAEQQRYEMQQEQRRIAEQQRMYEQQARLDEQRRHFQPSAYPVPEAVPASTPPISDARPQHRAMHKLRAEQAFVGILAEVRKHAAVLSDPPRLRAGVSGSPCCLRSTCG